MWGIIPAAGSGTRIQPLAFSKELLPVGGRVDGAVERPRAISEYLVDRMITGGAKKLCFVIAPGKSDILEYYGGGSLDSATISFVVQPHPIGLCDAIFQAAPLIAPNEAVCIGLPDTIWFPEDALCALPDSQLSFLLFPVEHPQFFDAVRTDKRWASAGNSGETAGRLFQLDLGGVQNARGQSCMSCAPFGWNEIERMNTSAHS